jgi:ATP-dependent helicase/nuclease subunit A
MTDTLDSSRTERHPADEAVREAALDPARNYIVQAPAGSGKTELLTRRFLRLLAVVERPEEIVAITFTRKAAGEMRQRIAESLQLGCESEAPQEPHRRRTWQLAHAALARDEALGWNLLHNPRRLRVETIDALNAWLARQLPVASRLGAAPMIADEPEPVYRAAARAILLAAGGDEPHSLPAAALLRHLGGRFSQAEDLLVSLLRSRDHWLGRIVAPGQMKPDALRKQLDAALRHFVEDELQRTRDSLPQSIGPELAALAARAAVRAPELEWLAPLAALDDWPSARAEALPQWRALAELLLTRQGAWRRSLNRNHGFPPAAREDKDAMAALLEELEVRADAAGLQRARTLPEPAYGDGRWQILAQLLALLPVCAAVLEVEFAARGESDYIGIARAALDALGEPEAPTDLALALDCRISHLLVDEFQDTSQAQVELLERLTAGWSEGDGRSLFCVGDPMQSIYRFREADVGRFLKAQRRGIGDIRLETLQLTVNFRSQAGLVDWVSSVFPSIFPTTADLSLGAVPFAPSASWHEALPGVAVNCAAVPKGDAQAEAEVVRNIVQQIRTAEPEASIAILVRSRRHLARVTPMLKAAAIPCRAVEIEPLAEGPAIRDLEALTRALCHRADRTAWLAVLRAPWCGLELADLLQLAGEKRHEPWARLNDPEALAALSPAGRRRAERLVAALAPAMAERGRQPLRRVVQGAWLALGGPATLERASELDDARTFLEFLDGCAPQGDLDDPPGLSSLLDALYAAPETVSPDAVQLLTIHKAKGLQFDHVLMPGLDKQSGWHEKRLLRWLEQVREDGTELILAPVEALGEERDELHRALRDLDARRDLLELDRVLYVALTRARRRLHLVAGLGPDEEDSGAPPAPRAGTLLERLWPALGDAFLAAHGADAAGDAQREESREAPRLRRLVAAWQAPALPPGARWSVPPAAAPAGSHVEYDWSGREARAVGIAVHRLLELIAVEGPDAWPAARLAQQGPLLTSLLREAGLHGEDVAPALARCQEALRTTLEDARGRWLLDPEHRDASSERRVSGWLDGQVFNGIVDRSFVDAEGVLWIVDYKAGRHEGGELEAFLDRERERYRSQLERYARLLGPGHAGPVRLGLYFPQHAGWREWSPGAN